MTVLVPADYESARAALRTAALTPGPFYIRLGRTGSEAVYPENHEFVVGKANVLREGTDVTIIACGLLVAEALKASDSLADEDISAEVIDIASLKPIDAETIIASARKTGAVVTAEEHSVIGGLGSAVAEVLAQEAPTKMRFVGVKDVFGTSGEPDQLMAHYGLTATDIASAARELVD
jgi:transketolase